MNFEDIEAGTRPEVTEAREARRLELRDYARAQLTDPQSKAQALVNIVGRAIELTAGDPRMFENRADMVMNDLLAVIVGDGFGEEERGTGRHYVGTDNQGGDEPFFGDDGFKPEFRDARGYAGFQVHHAVAGLVMAYRFGPGVEWGVELQESEPEDDRLYDATFSIGNWVSPERLDQLPQRIIDELCDGTCRLLDLDDPYPSCDAPPADRHAKELDDALYPTSDAPPADRHAKELDDALYPTSDAPPADQHARELDDALYPTSDAPAVQPEPLEAHEPGSGAQLAPDDRAKRERAETGGATTRAEAHRESEAPPEPPPTDHVDPPGSNSGPEADTTAPRHDDDRPDDAGKSAAEAPAGGPMAPEPEAPSSAQGIDPASTHGDEQSAPPAAQDGGATSRAETPDESSPIAQPAETPDESCPIAQTAEAPEQSYPMAGEATHTAEDGDYTMPEAAPAPVVEAPPSDSESEPAEEVDCG